MARHQHRSPIPCRERANILAPNGAIRHRAIGNGVALQQASQFVEIEMGPKIRDEIFEDAAALGGKGFSARFGQYNGWLVSRQPALRAIFCPSAGIFEGFRHRYAGGGSSFGFPRARPAPGITTSPEWRLLPA
jgi:hypothetical protein